MEQKVTGGSVVYAVHGETVSVVSCQLESSHFEIPDQIEGKTVTEIGKKAFLSNKVLREVALPDTITMIGEWAFAHCENLKTVWLPKQEIWFGRGVFKGCSQLRHIFAGNDAKQKVTEQKIAGLLGAVPVMLEADYLLSPMEAGEELWLNKLDARLWTLLEKPDKEGYSRQVLCGEEDLMASLDLYLADRRKQKARLCYMRLLNDFGLKQEMKENLQKWLSEHAKGCESEAAWEVVYQENSKNCEYYRIFAEAGCVTEGNFEGLLSDMGDHDPEMKAWFLRYKKEHMETADFFDSLSLDW